MGAQGSTLAAVVLAAGASIRMGRPKALIEWRGRPFVLHAVRLARAVSATPVVVVEGATALPDTVLDGAMRVRNEAWVEGPLGSLQRGVATALGITGPAPTGIMVLTVDRPHIQPSTVQALADAYRRDPGQIWQPRVQGRRGHPIVYPTDIARRLLALRSPQTPRTLLAEDAIAARRRQVEVEDLAVLDNLDRPEDLARLGL